MKVYELSKQLNITNKELIEFLNNNNYDIKSHMANLTEDMIDLALSTTNTDVVKEEEQSSEYIPTNKTYNPDERIPCQSLVPWKLTALGIDSHTVYHWNYYGDIDYLKYSDLQALRRKDIIRNPKIMILDPEICYQWRRELGDVYKYFEGIEYPELFFDDTNFPDVVFKEKLLKGSNVFRELIRVTAITMIKNGNYPSLNKLNIIDEVLGTCIKEFL